MVKIEFWRLFWSNMKTFRSNELNDAARLLKEGGLLAFPTETVFGFGVIYDNEEAYKKLVSVKRRPPEQPFTVMCADTKDLSKLAYLNDKAIKLVESFMPGQITLIVKAKEGLPSFAVSKEGNIGVRIPNYDIIRELIREVGKPLLVPSANRHGERPALNAQEVIDNFSKEIDGIILGDTISNIPSTIVLINDKVHLIREGSISKEKIENVIGDKVLWKSQLDQIMPDITTKKR